MCLLKDLESPKDLEEPQTLDPRKTLALGTFINNLKTNVVKEESAFLLHEFLNDFIGTWI